MRDRWPVESFNTFPLSPEEDTAFESFLRGAPLPLRRLLLINATVLLERGLYSASVIQSAASVELGITHAISARLTAIGLPAAKIAAYEDKTTLGMKVGFKPPDPRALEAYYGGSPEFTTLLAALRHQFVGPAKPCRP